jgi:hypothetical protein
VATTSLIVGLAAATALAITLATWNVAPGGSITLTGGQAVFKDSTTTWALRCQSSSGGGSLKTGHDLRGQDHGSIKTLTFTTCHGPVNTAYTITASLSVPWTLNATAYKSTTGVTTMPIEGFRAGSFRLGPEQPRADGAYRLSGGEAMIREAICGIKFELPTRNGSSSAIQHPD